jgi:hypothetical protein
VSTTDVDVVAAVMQRDMHITHSDERHTQRDGCSGEVTDAAMPAQTPPLARTHTRQRVTMVLE